MSSSTRRYISARELLVNLDLASSLEVADRLIEAKRVRVCGTLVTSGSMTVASDESDIVLLPKNSLTSISSGLSADRPQAAVLESKLLLEPHLVTTAATPALIGGVGSVGSTPRIPVQPDATASVGNQIVSPKDVARTLLRYLVANTLQISLLQATKLVASGLIKANGHTTTNPELLVPIAETFIITCSEAIGAIWLSCLGDLTFEEAKDLVNFGRIVDKTSRIIRSDELFPLHRAKFLRICGSACNARLLSKEVLTRQSFDTKIETVPVTFGDYLELSGLASSREHAMWLCENGRIKQGDSVVKDVLAPPLQDSPEIKLLPRGVGEKLTSVEQEMRACAEKLGLAALNRPNVMVMRSEFKKLNITEAFASKAISEFGAELEVAWLQRVGAPVHSPQAVNKLSEVAKRTEKRDVDPFVSRDLNNINKNQPNAKDDPAKKDNEGDSGTAYLVGTADETKAPKANLLDDDKELNCLTSFSKNDYVVSPESSFGQDSPKSAENVIAASCHDSSEALGKVTIEERNIAPVEDLNNSVSKNFEAEGLSLVDVLQRLQVAEDTEDATSLISNGCVLVDGTVVSSLDALVYEKCEVRLTREVSTMRRVVPRASNGNLDVFSWPNPDQAELLWAFAAISCFICNVSIEAYACGIATSPAAAVSLFEPNGTVYTASPLTSSLLSGVSRLILERGCNEGWTRYEVVPTERSRIYKKQARRAGVFFVDSKSEYFWPLVGVYKDKDAIHAFLDAFFLGEEDSAKRKRKLSVLLDFSLYVSDDSLLLSSANAGVSSHHHKIRVLQLSASRGLTASAWSSAFKALVQTS